MYLHHYYTIDLIRSECTIYDGHYVKDPQRTTINTCTCRPTCSVKGQWSSLTDYGTCRSKKLGLGLFGLSAQQRVWDSDRSGRC